MDLESNNLLDNYSNQYHPSKKWLDIIKKNDKDFEIKNIKEKNHNNQKPILKYNLKDADEEFEFIFNKLLVNIKIDFENYINNQAFPFMDNNLNLKSYNFYDFLKYNSHNYSDVINKVDEENKEHIIDFDKEEEDLVCNEEYE
jgi:hypothetical protein